MFLFTLFYYLFSFSAFGSLCNQLDGNGAFVKGTRLRADVIHTKF